MSKPTMYLKDTTLTKSELKRHRQRYTIESKAAIKARLSGQIGTALRHDKNAWKAAVFIRGLTGKEPDEITQFDLKKNPRKRVKKNPASRYEVIVGNIGTVYSGSNLKIAMQHYKEYVEQSKTNYGRAGSEPVTLIKNDDIYKEYFGTLQNKEYFGTLQNKEYFDTLQNPRKRVKKNPSTGIRIVHNKLLGGWFVVRGPHQTPLNGRFDSKAEAQAWLQQKKNPLRHKFALRKKPAKSLYRGRFNVIKHKKKIRKFAIPNKKSYNVYHQSPNKLTWGLIAFFPGTPIGKAFAIDYAKRMKARNRKHSFKVIEK